MEVQFSKWGNSVALRVPSKVAETLGIAPGGTADLELQSDRIVIIPRTHSYRLEDLIKVISAKNLHHEISTGQTLGAEVID